MGVEDISVTQERRHLLRHHLRNDEIRTIWHNRSAGTRWIVHNRPVLLDPATKSPCVHRIPVRQTEKFVRLVRSITHPTQSDRRKVTKIQNF